MGEIWCRNGILGSAKFSGGFCESGIDKVSAMWYTENVGVVLWACHKCLCTLTYVVGHRGAGKT